jgi:hypothetical protein
MIMPFFVYGHIYLLDERRSWQLKQKIDPSREFGVTKAVEE